MALKLIADGGSTKTRWIVSDSGRAVADHTGEGINPAQLSEEAVSERIARQLQPIAGHFGEIEEVWYYGAGCIPRVIPAMERIVTEITGCRRVTAASDMLGAARALCGHRRGIACIPGTGPNSCLFDGDLITAHTPALGFILGDEGSGASLGRRLLSDRFKGLLPQDIASALDSEMPITEAELIENTYRRPMAGSFLAGFAPFVCRHIDHQYMCEMATDEFRRFFERNVANYPEARSTPLFITGSIAVNFAGAVSLAAKQCGLRKPEIIADPAPRLADYHR